MKNNIKYLLFIFQITNCFVLFAQNDNYKVIDSIAIQTVYKGDLPILVNELTLHCKNDLEKARSIYTWITENIIYDAKEFNKNKKIAYTCKKASDCQKKKANWELEVINKALRKKKAVCSGYALLFYKMCGMANVQSLYVSGFTKSKPNQIGKMGIDNHAWNMLFIDNKTYYIDVTWAAGFCEVAQNGTLKKCIKKRNDFYWLTPIEKFTINHFPKNPQDIPNFNISKDSFKNQPFVDHSIIDNLENLNPKTGILKVVLGDTLTFSFSLNQNLKKIQINTNLKRNPSPFYTDQEGIIKISEKKMEKQEYIAFTNINHAYELNYIIDNENIRFIDILWDFNTKIRYLITVTKPIQYEN